MLRLILIGLFFYSIIGYSEIIKIPQAVQSSLAAGDIIIRKGGGPLSYQLMNVTKEDYSHCGIIVRENNQWMVIQSKASDSENGIDGVQITSIDDFVKFTVDSILFICRPKIDKLLDYKIVDRAYYYLNLAIPFDHRFRLQDSEKFYCLELLFHIFIDVYNENIFNMRKQQDAYILLFSTFFNEDKFEAIYTLKSKF